MSTLVRITDKHIVFEKFNTEVNELQYQIRSRKDGHPIEYFSVESVKKRIPWGWEEVFNFIKKET